MDSWQNLPPIELIMGNPFIQWCMNRLLNETSLYWPGLIVSLLLAIFIYYMRERDTKSLHEYLVPLKILKHRSTRMDVMMLLFVGLYMIYGQGYLVQNTNAFLLGWSDGLLIKLKEGVSQTLMSESASTNITYGFYVFIWVDFGLFFAHYLMHKVPFFWEFHKVHHSAQVMTPITVLRMHPFDFFINAVTISLCLCAGHIIGVFIFPPESIPARPFETLSWMGIFYVMGAALRHSHVWLSYGKQVERIFVSPAQHQIHHSAHKRHWDKNMGSVLSIWDGLFGTLYTTSFRDKETFRYGLYKKEDRLYQSPIIAIIRPFWQCFIITRLKLLKRFK